MKRLILEKHIARNPALLKTKKPTVYKVSKNLLDIVSKLKIKHPRKMFPGKCLYYFLFPKKNSGPDIEGITFSIEGDEFCFSTIYKQLDKAPNIQFLDKEKVIQFLEGKMPQVDNPALTLMIRVLYNLALYIQNECEPFSEGFNFFERPKEYRGGKSNLSYAKLGYNLLNMKWKSNTNVSGHFRWQRCGKEFNDVKLIYVKPHKRQLIKNIVCE